MLENQNLVKSGSILGVVILLLINALPSCSPSKPDPKTGQNSPDESEQLCSLLVHAIKKQPVAEEDMISLIEGKTWDELKGIFDEAKATIRPAPDKWDVARAFGKLSSAYTSKLQEDADAELARATKERDEALKRVEKSLQRVVDKERRDN